MAGAIKTYTPKDIVVTLAQQYKVGGIVSIGLTFPTERYTMVRGLFGKNARVRNPDTSCTLTIELLQTSVANDVLSDIVSQDSITGRGRLSVVLSDTSGTTSVQSFNAFVNNYPETAFTNNIETRRWTITMMDTDYTFIGGNSKPRPQFLEDAARYLAGAAGKLGDYATSAVSAISTILN